MTNDKVDVRTEADEALSGYEDALAKYESARVALWAKLTPKQRQAAEEAVVLYGMIGDAEHELRDVELRRHLPKFATTVSHMQDHLDRAMLAEPALCCADGNFPPSPPPLITESLLKV
jgi:hypothetical protein